MYPNILVNLEKLLQSRLDDGKLIASPLNNAQVTLTQHDGMEKYKDLGTEKIKKPLIKILWHLRPNGYSFQSYLNFECMMAEEATKSIWRQVVQGG
jgi:hypothetical protein